MVRFSAFSSGVTPIKDQGLAMAEPLEVFGHDRLEPIHVGPRLAGQEDVQRLLVGGQGAAAHWQVNGRGRGRELDRELMAPVLGELLELTTGVCGFGAGGRGGSGGTGWGGHGDPFTGLLQIGICDPFASRP